MLSGSLDQARYVFNFARGLLGEEGYTYTDSANRIGIKHNASRTRLEVKSSRARSAFGIVNARLVIADEPGAFDQVGGTMMADAIDTSLGKPGNDLTVVYIGTLSPALAGWWHDLVNAGSHGSTYVQAVQGDRSKWDQWREIKRCNPLMASFKKSREVLIEERDAARRDSRLKARFLSYRLNVPTEDEISVLLTVDEWRAVLARDVPPRRGRPKVGIDLGGGRAWSAAVAVWPSGRVEALALAPGTPSLEDQERRDQAPRGVYQRLAKSGVLSTDGDLRVPRVRTLVNAVMPWRPSSITCDRFRLSELQDAIRGRVPVIPRIARWSDASSDIRALRKQALDGPLAVALESRDLLGASMAVARVEADTSGNFRLRKRGGSNNTARDDVVAALVLAAGAHSRRRRSLAGAVRSYLVEATA